MDKPAPCHEILIAIESKDVVSDNRESYCLEWKSEDSLREARKMEH